MGCGWPRRVIAILESVLHLHRYQQLWTTYQAIAEAMTHENFMYLAKTGDYATAADPHALLVAERVETVGSGKDTTLASPVQQKQKVKAG